MRENVCIVLNEREPNKAKAVHALVNKLSANNITSSQFPITKNINDVIKEANARILVIDYLLGDYSTGLDVLSTLNQGLDQDSDPDRPIVFFLTDEPSVQVAVEAMKLGATDYFELDNPQAIDILVRSIKSALNQKKLPVVVETKQNWQLKSLIAHNSESIETINQAKNLIATHTPIIAIYGPRGCGRSVLAQAIQTEIKNNCATNLLCESINLDLFCEDLSTIFKANNQNKLLQLTNNRCLFFDHLEADLDFVDLLEKNFARIWPNANSKNNQCTLVLGISDAEALKTLKRLVPETKVLNIKSINQRREEIPGYLNYWLNDLQKNCSVKIKALSSQFILEISKLDWHGELTQLKSVFIDTIMQAHFSSEDIIQILNKNWQSWIDSHNIDSHTNNEITCEPILCAKALESSNMNYRIAAAKLGISVQQLRAAIA